MKKVVGHSNHNPDTSLLHCAVLLPEEKCWIWVYSSVKGTRLALVWLGPGPLSTNGHPLDRDLTRLSTFRMSQRSVCLQRLGRAVFYVDLR